MARPASPKRPYELFLQLEEIEHRTMKVGRPESKRIHRALPPHAFRRASPDQGPTTWHETVAEMQKDLNAYPETYNRQMPHRGRGMKGRTPYEVFKAGIPNKFSARKKPVRKALKTAA